MSESPETTPLSAEDALVAALRNVRTRSYVNGKVTIASDHFDDLLEAATKIAARAAVPAGPERRVTQGEPLYVEMLAARPVPAAEPRETIDQRAARMQRERQARYLSGEPASAHAAAQKARKAVPAADEDRERHVREFNSMLYRAKHGEAVTFTDLYVYWTKNVQPWAGVSPSTGAPDTEEPA